MQKSHGPLHKEYLLLAIYWWQRPQYAQFQKQVEHKKEVVCHYVVLHQNMSFSIIAVNVWHLHDKKGMKQAISTVSVSLPYSMH